MTTDIFEQEEKLEKRTNRPHGVTIVATLMIINGIILIAGAVFTIYFVPILVHQITDTFTGNKTVSFGLNLTDGNEISPQVVASITDTIITIAMITAAIGVAIGIACFLLAWGLFMAKGWSWVVTVILAIISIVFGLMAVGGGGFVNIINIIISGLILYYLYRPMVKAYFGRVKIPR